MPELLAAILLLFHPELLSEPTELALELTSLWYPSLEQQCWSLLDSGWFVVERRRSVRKRSMEFWRMRGSCKYAQVR